MGRKEIPLEGKQMPNTSNEFMLDPSDVLHTVEGAARRLGGLSHWTIRGWLKEGKLRAFHAGARVLIPESSIQAFLQESTRQHAK